MLRSRKLRIAVTAVASFGTVMGLARLSRNWLVAKLAGVYVETFRNIPLALQLLFWWGLLREIAPAPRQAWQPLPGEPFWQLPAWVSAVALAGAP